MRNSQGGSNDGNNDVEMVAYFFDGPAVDVHAASALEFPVDVSDFSNAWPTNISRRSRRERTSRLARFRRDVAIIRRNHRAAQNGARSVPLTEPLDENSEIPLV